VLKVLKGLKVLTVRTGQPEGLSLSAPIERRTENVEHRTSNIERRRSNVERTGASRPPAEVPATGV
jgi:hypothetical protein